MADGRNAASPRDGLQWRGGRGIQGRPRGPAARGAIGSVGDGWGGGTMTYCLGITTKDGFVAASDSRSNAGYDQVNVCRKMHIFARPGRAARSCC